MWGSGGAAAIAAWGLKWRRDTWYISLRRGGVTELAFTMWRGGRSGKGSGCLGLGMLRMNGNGGDGFFVLWLGGYRGEGGWIIGGRGVAVD